MTERQPSCFRTAAYERNISVNIGIKKRNLSRELEVFRLISPYYAVFKLKKPRINNLSKNVKCRIARLSHFKTNNVGFPPSLTTKRPTAV